MFAVDKLEMQAMSREIHLPVSAAASAAHGSPSADCLLLVAASLGRSPLLLRRPVSATHVAVGRPKEHTGSVVKRTIERRTPKIRQVESFRQ